MVYFVYLPDFFSSHTEDKLTILAGAASIKNKQAKANAKNKETAFSVEISQ